MIIKYLFLVFIVCCFLTIVNGDKNKDRTYINLESPIPCIRRFNATHQIGCSKDDIGDYDGIIYVIRNQFELNRLNSIDKLSSSRKLILVTSPFMYQFTIEVYKQKKEIINGIVVVVDLDPSQSAVDSNQSFTFNYTNPANYSSDSKNPNFLFGFYKDRSTSTKPIDWNSLAGTSHMFENFDSPFYLITSEKDAKRLVDDCYEKFNRKVFERIDKSNAKFSFSSTDLLCGVRMGLEMSGAVNSDVCIRRSSVLHTIDSNSFCDPLGGSNYFTFLSHKPSNEKPLILLTTGIDAFTMFEYYTPAANKPISSIIGMLSLVELLAKYRDDFTDFNLIFVLFDNEAFDYGGSSRFVNDLNVGKFPSLTLDTPSGSKSFQLSKENMTTMIELGQLGSLGLSDNNLLYVHRDPVTYGENKTISTLVDAFIAKLSNFSSQSIVPVTNLNQQLPPSSIQSFLKGNINLAGLLVADFEKAFKNNYYHSIFDTPDNINITYPANITEKEAESYTTLFSQRIQVLLTNLAQTVYNLYTAKGNLNDEISLLTLNRLSYCFYKNSTCSYLKGILSDTQWSSYQTLLDSAQPLKRLSFYTGVNDNHISGKWLAHALMRYFSRNRLFDSLNSSDCSKDSNIVKKMLNETNLNIKSFTFINNYNNSPNLTLCVASALFGVSSVSPAFYKSDDGIVENTNLFSAWSESSWTGEDNQMRLFMFSSDLSRDLTFGVGIGTFFLSFLLTWILNKHSSRFFTFNHPEQTAEFIEQT